MEATPKRPPRARRADAARNRERLLDAAKAILGGDGGVTLEGIARAAGLGIGTLYRHFPTRESLYEAVYRREIDMLVALGEEAKRVGDPAEGLRRWLHAVIAMVATKKGMIAAFALEVDCASAISATFSGPLIAAANSLFARAVAAGRLRGEITGEELLLSVIGMCTLRDQPFWEASVVRLTDSLLAGLAYGAPSA